MLLWLLAVCVFGLDNRKEEFGNDLGNWTRTIFDFLIGVTLTVCDGSAMNAQGHVNDNDNDSQLCISSEELRLNNSQSFLKPIILAIFASSFKSWVETG